MLVERSVNTVRNLGRMVVAVGFVLAGAGAMTMVAGSPAGAFTQSQLESRSLSLTDLPSGWAPSTVNVLSELPACVTDLQLSAAGEDASASTTFSEGTLPLVQENLGWVSNGHVGGLQRHRADAAPLPQALRRHGRRHSGHRDARADVVSEVWKPLGRLRVGRLLRLPGNQTVHRNGHRDLPGRTASSAWSSTASSAYPRRSCPAHL